MCLQAAVGKSGRPPQRHLQALPLILGCPSTPRTGPLGFQFRGACWIGTGLGRRKRVASTRPLAQRPAGGSCATPRPVCARDYRHCSFGDAYGPRATSTQQLHGTIGTATGVGDAYGQRATSNGHAATVVGKLYGRARTPVGELLLATPPRRAPRCTSTGARRYGRTVQPSAGECVNKNAC